jgi:hypothetical protein
LIICTTRKKSASHAVHLVDEGQARHAVLVGLAPHGLGLRLDAAHGAENRHGAVQNPERTLNLDGEIHMTGRIDDVDPVVAPQTSRSRGSDRNATFLLLDHPIHGRGALVDLADFVVVPRVIYVPLGGGRISRFDVCPDADITGPL